MRFFTWLADLLQIRCPECGKEFGYNKGCVMCLGASVELREAPLCQKTQEVWSK